MKFAGGLLVITVLTFFTFYSLLTGISIMVESCSRPIAVPSHYSMLRLIPIPAPARKKPATIEELIEQLPPQPKPHSF